MHPRHRRPDRPGVRRGRPDRRRLVARPGPRSGRQRLSGADLQPGPVAPLSGAPRPEPTATPRPGAWPSGAPL
ncbi:conserved hypothetical protein [Streptomyces misionensis JCM 4497]